MSCTALLAPGVYPALAFLNPLSNRGALGVANERIERVARIKNLIAEADKSE